MKTIPFKVSSTEMRNINRSAVMEYIQRRSSTFRSEIAESLNISLPTIMKIVEELVTEGLVIETAEREPSGGRRRPLLRFNASGNLVIGVDLGGTKCYGAVANMGGEILLEKTLTHHETHGEASYAMLEQFIEELLAEGDEMPGQVRGVGVGVPGVMEQESGLVKICPALGWNDFPLQERLNRHFDVPVLVENDVNLAALGELWFGVDEGVENLVLLAVGTGVGAGVVINGMVYSGAQSSAGETGYLMFDRASLDQEYPGFGALEQHISGPGIAERARRRLADQRSPAELEAVSAETVFAAARQGEPWAREVLDDTIDEMAQAVAAVQLLLDPEIILLSGGVTRGADLLIDPILARLSGRIPLLPRLSASRLGYQAAVLGAVVKVFRRLVGVYRVMKVV